jgi:hypothetical protein
MKKPGVAVICGVSLVAFGILTGCSNAPVDSAPAGPPAKVGATTPTGGRISVSNQVGHVPHLLGITGERPNPKKNPHPPLAQVPKK